MTRPQPCVHVLAYAEYAAACRIGDQSKEEAAGQNAGLLHAATLLMLYSFPVSRSSSNGL